MAQWLGVGHREKFNRFNSTEFLLNDVARCHFCSLVNINMHVFPALRQCALRALVSLGCTCVTQGLQEVKTGKNDAGGKDKGISLGDSTRTHSPQVGPKAPPQTNCGLDQKQDSLRRAGVLVTVAGRVSHQDDKCM